MLLNTETFESRIVRHRDQDTRSLRLEDGSPEATRVELEREQADVQDLDLVRLEERVLPCRFSSGLERNTWHLTTHRIH